MLGDAVDPPIGSVLSRLIGATGRKAGMATAEMTAADSLYAERNQLVALLAQLYPAGTKRTDIEGWEPEWHGCVYIDLPTGQASWHYHEREAGLFAGLPTYTGEWDGHTTELKYERVAKLIHELQILAWSQR